MAVSMSYRLAVALKAALHLSRPNFLSFDKALLLLIRVTDRAVMRDSTLADHLRTSR
jgi:hypothetical protein